MLIVNVISKPDLKQAKFFKYFSRELTKILGLGITSSP